MNELRTAPAWLIRGNVFHQRVRPVLHQFTYPVFYVRINLARLDELNSLWFGVNKWRIASFWVRDYGARDGSSLQGWMRSVLQQADVVADGDIWLQTFPRLFGYVFNPVSFWYCYDIQGGLRAVLAEVNSTFGETHRYLITAPDQQIITAETELQCSKNLHVSPFCQVRGYYRFKFNEKSTAQIKSSFINLDYADENGLIIKTAIGGTCAAFTPQNIRRAVLRQPLLTLSIVLGIYSQALALWRKKVPFFTKPIPPNASMTHSSDFLTITAKNKETST